MRQIIHIIRKDDLIKEKKEALHKETDYLLLTLYQAMNDKDAKEHKKCMDRLHEIQNELIELAK